MHPCTLSPRRRSSSESKLEREAKLSIPCGRRNDVVSVQVRCDPVGEGRFGDCRTGVGKLRCICQAKGLRTKLEFEAFSNRKCAVKACIEIEETWPKQDV